MLTQGEGRGESACAEVHDEWTQVKGQEKSIRSKVKMIKVD